LNNLPISSALSNLRYLSLHLDLARFFHKIFLFYF